MVLFRRPAAALLPLLLLAATTTALAELAPSNCVAHGCTMHCGDTTYDLTPFVKNMPAAGYYSAIDPQNDLYYFTPCAPISKVTCQASAISGPAALQNFGAQPPQMQSDCAATGSFASQKCTSLSNGTKGSGVACSYTGGDGGRSQTITYSCAKHFTTPTATQNFLTYSISIAGPAACPGGASGGGSWGTLFLIIFLVVVVVYFGGGFAYNYKVRELRGTEAVPQFEQWKMLPGLVKDGCIFSYRKSRKFYAYARSKYGRASTDPLERGLADDDATDALQE